MKIIIETIDSNQHILTKKKFNVFLYLTLFRHVKIKIENHGISTMLINRNCLRVGSTTMVLGSKTIPLQTTN